MSGPHLYQMEDIVLERGGRRLLDGVSLALTPGTVTVVIGPNGAGKSTLLKVLAGELRPARGRVTLDGRDIATVPPALLARRRAVLAQSTEVAFPFTVAEVVGIGLMGAGPGAEPRIEAALAKVDLSGFAARRIEQLSGGERQRVHLARVLAQLDASGEGAGFLLLDEPTSSLDLSHQLLVLEVARRHAQAGGGVLAILHDLNLAAMAADVLVVVEKGRIAAAGPPSEVLTDGLLRTVFRVEARMNAVPAGPFLLPQSIGGSVGQARR